MLDSLTGLPDDINIDRLVNINFVPELHDLNDDDLGLNHLLIGGFVAFANGTNILLVQTQDFKREETLTGIPWEPVEQPKGRCMWKPIVGETVVIVWDDVICTVHPNEKEELDDRSVQKPAKLGAEM